MTEHTFLEDVGTPCNINAVGNAKAWEVRNLRNDPTLPPLMYVIESEIGQEFLLGRGISGRPKFNMIRSVAKSFFELFYEQLRGKELSQYIILGGAYPFDLQFAFGVIPPFDRMLLPTGFINLQRVLGQGKADWEIQAQNLIGNYQGETWLVPDTVIASGSPITYLLEHAFAQHLPKQVYVITTCGSLEGIRRIYQECLRKNVELIPVFSQCIFEVSKRGNLPGLPLTDLSILNPGSIPLRRLYDKAFDRYQGARMCSIGDITESLDDPINYSIHTLWEMQVLEMDPEKEDWNYWTVDVRKKSFQEKVVAFNPSLAGYFQKIWKTEP